MKYKYIVLGIFISIIFIMFFSLITINNRLNRVVYIKEISEYSKKVTILKNDIKGLDDGACKDNLNRMLDKINKTYFKENITLKKYYEAYYDDKTFINIYEDIKSSCEIKKEKAEEIYIDVLASTIYPESIKYEYAHVYEIKFIDKYSNDTYNKQLDETGTYVNKTLELNILKDLLNEVAS